MTSIHNPPNNQKLPTPPLGNMGVVCSQNCFLLFGGDGIFREPRENWGHCQVLGEPAAASLAVPSHWRSLWTASHLEIVLRRLEFKADLWVVFVSLMALPQSRWTRCGAPSSFWRCQRLLLGMVTVHCRKLKHFKCHMQQITKRLKDHNLLSTSRVTKT